MTADFLSGLHTLRVGLLPMTVFVIETCNFVSIRHADATGVENNR